MKGTGMTTSKDTFNLFVFHKREGIDMTDFTDISKSVDYSGLIVPEAYYKIVAINFDNTNPTATVTATLAAYSTKALANDAEPPLFTRQIKFDLGTGEERSFFNGILQVLYTRIKARSEFSAAKDA